MSQLFYKVFHISRYWSVISRYWSTNIWKSSNKNHLIEHYTKSYWTDIVHFFLLKALYNMSYSHTHIHMLMAETAIQGAGEGAICRSVSCSRILKQAASDSTSDLLGEPLCLLSYSRPRYLTMLPFFSLPQFIFYFLTVLTFTPVLHCVRRNAKDVFELISRQVTLSQLDSQRALTRVKCPVQSIKLYILFMFHLLIYNICI